MEPDKAKSKFCQILHTDVIDLLTKLDKVIKQLESMMAAKGPKDSVIKKLAQELPGLDASVDEAFTMGKNFGYEVKGTRAKSGSNKRTRRA